jgi:hypothetical protein
MGLSQPCSLQTCSKLRVGAGLGVDRARYRLAHQLCDTPQNRDLQISCTYSKYLLTNPLFPGNFFNGLLCGIGLVTLSRACTACADAWRRPLKRTLDACAEACRVCVEECAKHAAKDAHCRIFAEPARTANGNARSPPHDRGISALGGVSERWWEFGKPTAGSRRIWPPVTGSVYN